jgi:hypothetical protein
MLTNPQKAEAVVAALEEQSPQLLAQLAANGQLLPVLKDRVEKFNQEVVRQMKGRDPRDDLVVEEGLMPLLTDFPEGKDLHPLTPEQEKKVDLVLQQYHQSLNPPILRPLPSRKK